MNLVSLLLASKHANKQDVFYLNNEAKPCSFILNFVGDVHGWSCNSNKQQMDMATVLAETEGAEKDSFGFGSIL